MLGPNASDPFGQQREEVGKQLVDTVLAELSLSDCIQLALNKAAGNLEKNREDKLVITKLEEAQMWSSKSSYLKRGGQSRVS